MFRKIMVMVLLFCINLLAIPPHEEKHMQIFEVLYKKQFINKDEEVDFFDKNFKIQDGSYLYTFPNKSIENVYDAYVRVIKKNTFGDSILHEKLPKRSIAFKKEADANMQFSYVLLYSWDGENTLTITDTRFNGDNLCGIERLIFKQDSQKTTLEDSVEKYCF